MNTLFLDLIFIVSFQLCVFVPCIIWQLYMTKFKNVRYGRMHYVMTYIFIFYLSMALEVTGIPTIYELIRSGIVIDSGTINLVPFQQTLIQFRIFLTLSCLCHLASCFQ